MLRLICPVCYVDHARIDLAADITRFVFFFFQAEDGIRDAQESRGLGDVYKRQHQDHLRLYRRARDHRKRAEAHRGPSARLRLRVQACLLYTSDAADDLLCVDLGGRRIIKKNKTINQRAMVTTTERANHERQHTIFESQTCECTV